MLKGLLVTVVEVDTKFEFVVLVEVIMELGKMCFLNFELISFMMISVIWFRLDLLSKFADDNFLTDLVFECIY